MSTYRCFQKSTLSMGMVSIPVKFYATSSDCRVSFRMFTKAGNIIKQKFVDAVTGETADYEDLDKAYEYAKGQFVRFTKDELASFEQKSDTMDIKEFVSADEVEYLRVEKNYFLGPDKGGDKGLSLLRDVLRAQNKVAIAQWIYKGKTHLVAIRPQGSVLVLQVLFYEEEMRDCDQIEVLPLVISDSERRLAEQLVNALTKPFDASVYADSYAEKVRKAVDAKIAGKEVVTIPDAPQAKVLDLFEALKASIEKAAAK